MIAVNKKAYPILFSLLNDGTIFVNGMSYIGTAVDGVEVSIGTVGNEKEAEAYLVVHPTREAW